MESKFEEFGIPHVVYEVMQGSTDSKKHLEAIEIDPCVIRYISPEYQTKHMVLSVLRKNGMMYPYISDDFKTEESRIVAATQNGAVVQFFTEEEQTDAVLKCAVVSNSESFIYINNPSRELIILGIDNDPSCIKYFTQESWMCEYAVSKDPNVIRYVQDQTDKVCMLAVDGDGMLLACIKNKSIPVCELAVTRNGLSLKHVGLCNQTENIDKLAVSQNGKALKYCRFKTYTVCDLAFENNPYSYEYIPDDIKPSFRGRFIALL